MEELEELEELVELVELESRDNSTLTRSDTLQV